MVLLESVQLIFLNLNRGRVWSHPLNSMADLASHRCFWTRVELIGCPEQAGGVLETCAFVGMVLLESVQLIFSNLNQGRVWSHPLNSMADLASHRCFWTRVELIG
jgi:hypothetical protein